MTVEKEIPDYAMLPAKEMEETLLTPVTKGAVYSPMQVTNISEKPKTTITIEEDVLVPDTKPDLAEILASGGKARLSSREISRQAKAEESVSLSGDIELETLYLPEKPEPSCDEILSVQTRIPFKEQWHIKLEPEAYLILECEIEKIEYMVINERKYRVKILLAIYAREYAENKIDIFEGITGEEIQTRKEKIEISNVALRQKDSLTICENIEIKDECKIENILKQDICVMENYKQVTGEKAIINGFILVNVLYSAACEEGASEACQLRQVAERIEFTQFIPIRHIEDSGSCVYFDGNDLKVKLVQDEEAGETLRVEGELVTYIEIYQNTEKEIITDAYHREKDFVCDFKDEHGRSMVGSVTGESSTREIISPENLSADIEKILYTKADISECNSLAETGKILTEGKIGVNMICRLHGSEEGEPGRIVSLKEEVPFRIVTAAPQLMGGEIICHRLCIKDFWAEKINGKQIEFNATMVINAQIMRDVPFKVPANPAFEEKIGGEEKSKMTVYIAGTGDSLWSIAKKFKTTTAAIMDINELGEEEVFSGEKLLILK